MKLQWKKGMKKMEKELKNIREQKEREEERKLLDAIHLNHEKAYEKGLLQQQVNNIKKEKEMKKRRRIDIATILVMILMAIALVVMFVYATKNYEKQATTCDAEKGYMCSTYEIRQYAIRGE